MTPELRLAVLRDYREEGWPSMDLCADMLLAQLHQLPPGQVRATSICPPFRRRLSWLPGTRIRRWGINADRLLNRLWDYPRHLRPRARNFDFFHLCDHSYSQLLHVLPPGRAGVYCHDLDTFRCLLEPRQEPRPRWFRWMMCHILAGFQKAAVVFHTTQAVRRQIEKHGLIDPARLVHAPNGVALEFQPTSSHDDASVLPEWREFPFLLHVGSAIPRKRLDVLLDVFARVRAGHPDLRLVQAGGTWTDAQRQQMERLGLAASVQQLRLVSRLELAALYRRARLVLLPSEAEGFGLPVIEALACGQIVVASDLPVLREVGGPAVVYCPVADVPAWSETIAQLLDRPERAPLREKRLAQAAGYSWQTQAQIILEAYQRLDQDRGERSGPG